MYLSNAKVCACVHAVVNKRREREREGERDMMMMSKFYQMTKCIS